MDLNKSGNLIRELRKSKKMTQKQVANILGIEPKTVSKWETGRGFPDISFVSGLADIFGVSEKILLSGDLIKNDEEVGNMKRNKFYACKNCGRVICGTGEYEVICCGNKLSPLEPSEADEGHLLKVTEIENDYFVEIDHDMTKEHFISFIAYVSMDRMMLIRLYPEQNCEICFPKMFGGKFFCYCNKHGLFEYVL